MASTFALQGLLTLRERISIGKPCAQERLVNVRGDAKKEIEFWRWIVGRGLADNNTWSAPFWFIAKAENSDIQLEMFTDACTTIGGGYYISIPDCEDGSSGHFGHIRWSKEERTIFNAIATEETDINILEFITAVLAIITEKEYLYGRSIRIRVDNTAAVSWLNKLNAKHINGQLWVAVLVSILLDYNITFICDHISGITNLIADGLSRFLQEFNQELTQLGYRCMKMPGQAYRKAIWKGSSTDFWTGDVTIPLWHTEQATRN
jgi:hypothetical protein